MSVSIRILLSGIAMVLLVCRLPVAGAQALDSAALYSAEVQVDDQGEQARRKGFAAALWDVLVKVTGDRTVPSRPELQGLFGRAEALVQTYRYRELPRAAHAIRSDENLLDIDPGNAAAGPTHLLEVQFAAATLERQLGQLGIAVWGRERPQTLVWLAVQDGAQRYLLGANAAAEIGSALRRVAAQRGVPILLPVLDMADRAAVDFTDIRGNFSGPLLTASNRYKVDSVLAGNLSRVGGGAWHAQWTLYRRGQAHGWRVQSADAQAALLSGVEGVASVLSAELAVGRYGAGSAALRVNVRDVRAMQDYANVLGYLQGLSLVEAVMVERVAGDELTVLIRVRGDDADLRRAISLGSTLVAVRTDDPAASARELHYAYLP